MAFVEVYKSTSHGNVLDDRISFPKVNCQGLLPHLRDFLPLYHGCRHSNLELSMKYYRADSLAKSYSISKLERMAKKSSDIMKQ